jgi:hypothetical protein
MRQANYIRKQMEISRSEKQCTKEMYSKAIT